jgi:hypothetical protein
MVIEDQMQDFLCVYLRFNSTFWNPVVNENTKGDLAAQGNADKDASNQTPRAIKMQY